MGGGGDDDGAAAVSRGEAGSVPEWFCLHFCRSLFIVSHCHRVTMVFNKALREN